MDTISKFLQKQKGAKEGYKRVELSDFLDISKVLVFDHTKVWKKQTARPARRKLNYGDKPDMVTSKRRRILPAGGQEGPAVAIQTHPTLRNKSKTR